MFNFLKRFISKFEPKSEATQEVKFYALSSLVAIDCPIIPSSQLKRDWVSLQTNEFEHNKAFGVVPDSSRIRSSHRCPGLVDIFSRGYIVCAHRDFYFHTRGDIERPEYAAFSDSVAHDRTIRRRLGSSRNLGQMGGEAEPFTGPPLLGIKRPYPERTPNILFKLEIPWLVKAPPDISLLYVGVPLANNNDFTVVPGIQDTDLSSSVKVLLWWHHHDRGDVYIKKGTPLVQIIPVPKSVSTLGFSIVTDNQEVEEQADRRENLDYMLNSQVVVDYGQSSLTAKHFSLGANSLNKQGSNCPFKALW